MNTKISIILWHNLVALWYFPIILWNYYFRQMTPSRFLGLQTTQNVTFIFAILDFFQFLSFLVTKIHLLRCWTTRPTLVGWQVGAGLWSTPNAPRLTKRWFFSFLKWICHSLVCEIRGVSLSVGVGGVTSSHQHLLFCWQLTVDNWANWKDQRGSYLSEPPIIWSLRTHCTVDC